MDKQVPAGFLVFASGKTMLFVPGMPNKSLMHAAVETGPLAGLRSRPGGTFARYLPDIAL